MNNSKIQTYKDLQVWKMAIDISVEVYQCSMNFPTTEIYGLTNQIRRASNSISMNIAEGHGRKSTKTYIHFLTIAQGSLNELESGLLLSTRLGFITSDKLEIVFNLITEESKMLNALINILKTKTLSTKS